MHWNTASTGRGRTDMTPVCKKNKKNAKKNKTYKLVKSRTECACKETSDYQVSVESCAAKWVSGFFAYGRKSGRCKGSKCICLCEKMGTHVKQVSHAHYDLYRHARRTKSKSQKKSKSKKTSRSTRRRRGGSGRRLLVDERELVHGKSQASGWFRRRWKIPSPRSLVNKATNFAKKIGKGAFCAGVKGTLGLLKKGMKAACDVGQQVANKALSLAEKAIKKVTDLANKALAFADKALGMAIEFLKKLTAYTLTSVGFKMSNSVGPSVELNAAILNTETHAVNEYGIKLSLSGTSFKKIAGAAFKAIFLPIKKKALQVIKDLIKKVKPPVFELIQFDEKEAYVDQNGRERLIMVQMYDPLDPVMLALSTSNEHGPEPF